MTNQRKPPESENASTGANEGGTPLDRFRDLTKRILRVTPEQLKKEQRRYEKAKGTKRE